MTEGCTDKRFEKLLYAYELGLLSDEECRKVELHLLECRSCHDRTLQMEPAARLLRDDPDVRKRLENLAREEQRSAPTEQSRRRPWPRVVRFGLAVAAVVVLLILKPWDYQIRPDQHAIAAENRLVVLFLEDLAHLDEFIQTLPEQYETRVGAGGQRLSGGQRQRIALARAILRAPEILILDEATSQIDPESEKLINQVLTEFSRNRTLIMITHRLSNLHLADRVYQMDCGRIIEYRPEDQQVA